LKPDESTPKNSDLVDLFSAYHPIVVQLIKTTPTNSLHVATMADLQPIKNWYTSNIVLLGDAAHATTPNLGQGACQAIEDAYALANCLAKHNNQEKAFAAYQQLRLSKANGIVRTSRLLGEVAHFSNPLATTLRNSLMRITPNFIQQQQLARTFKPSFSN
jgi:2-polyprenyl-6-methoxyphenol hydroxylase-like FAD-dependent oxidoreductase